MNTLYIFGGTVLILFGIWLTIKQVSVFNSGKQGKFGGDINLLGVGITSIICGIIIILKHI
jgi:hypothetical protein